MRVKPVKTTVAKVVLCCKPGITANVSLDLALIRISFFDETKLLGME